MEWMPRMALRSTRHIASYLESAEYVHCCPENDMSVLSPSTAWDAFPRSSLNRYLSGYNCQALLCNAIFSKIRKKTGVHNKQINAKHQ